MVNISFAWTTPALVLAQKTCTRRDWNDDYARRFRDGELLTAYDRSPRVGGKPVGTIRLTRAPYYSEELPEEDFRAEGFVCLTELGLKVDGTKPTDVWLSWKRYPEPQWIVRFYLVSLTRYGEELKARWQVALATRAQERYYRDHPEAGRVSDETMRRLL